jgi:hypothetical protein
VQGVVVWRDRSDRRRRRLLLRQRRGDEENKRHDDAHVPIILTFVILRS